MKNLLQFVQKPAVWIFLIVASVISIGGILILLKLGYTPDDLKSAISALIDAISEYPILVYLSVLMVAGLPLPLSPFLILAGVLFTNRYGLPMALLLCHSAMALAMIWTYFVSAYPLRAVFEKILLKFADRFPEIPEEHKTKVALIVRITPGIPFFIQNYFLGVSRIPFFKYITISLAVQAFYTTGFVLGGGAIFEGKAGLAIAALSGIVVVGIVMNWMRSRNGITAK